MLFNVALPGSVFLIGAFLIGACLGSFYAVCIHRYLKNQSLGGFSACEACGKRLKIQHLIPIFSWLFLRGRCAFCAQKIGFSCLFIELLSALISLILAIYYGQTWTFLALLIIFGSLIVAAGIDFYSYILPDIITIPLIFLSFPTAVFLLNLHYADSLLGGLGGAFIFVALIYIFKKYRNIEALGFGDVKLIISLGFLCGLYHLAVLLLLSSLTALSLSFIWLLKSENKRTTIFPFGPFLCFGCFLTLLYGNYIQNKINLLFE